MLIEKSGSFYKEIENLVEEHLISTGHYTRYDKAQRGERETQAKPEPTKLSDKEIEDIIKEETNRLLEASTFDSGKIQESERSSVLDSPPPGTSGVAIEVETLTTSKHGECMQTSQPAVLQSVDASAISSESAVLKPSVKMSEPVAKIKAEEKEKADEMKISNAQSTNEGAQCQMATNQSKNVVGQTVSERGKTGEAERKYKHEQTVASNPATVTTTPGVNLLGKDRVMDVEVQPSSSQDIPSELRSDEKILVIPETENSGDCKPDVEKTTDPGAKVNRARKTKQSEMVNSPAEKTEVDLPALGNSGSRMQNLNKKSDMKKANVEVKTAESSAVVKTETKKVEVRKVKVDKPDVAGAEVEKLEVKKAEVVKAHVGKQSMEKSRKLKEKTKAKQTIASKPDSVKPATKKPIALPILFSTDEETDEDLRIPTINPGLIPVSKAEKFDIAELSDSDITVSSVHTSDLSSLEDSMSDMEFEDYQEQMKSEGKRSAASGEASAKDVDSEKNSGESGKREESESGAHEETKCAESGADTNKNVGSNDMTDSHVVQESPTPKTEASAEGENPPQVEESTCSQETPPPPEESLSKTTVVEGPSSAGVQDVEASDVDNETAMEDSDIGNIELGKCMERLSFMSQRLSEFIAGTYSITLGKVSRILPHRKCEKSLSVMVRWSGRRISYSKVGFSLKETLFKSRLGNAGDINTPYSQDVCEALRPFSTAAVLTARAERT